MNRTLLFLLVAGLSGLGGGWIFTELVLKKDSPEVAVVYEEAQELVGQPRPDFSLASTTGEFITAGDFDGQVLLINFWATWCAPCREEMPMLAQTREELNVHGFEVLGIALDDVQQARDFLDELGIRYPNAVGGADVMAAGVMYGNRAGLLPYSVLIDREGVVRWTSLGEIIEADLKERVKQLL
jgi:peroxiredoxin